MKIPDYITHYHLADRQPFLSLSELPGGKEDPVFQEFLHRRHNDASYRRVYHDWYVDARKQFEINLQKIFIKQGGKPIRKHPFYCLLGESHWFKNLNDNHREVRIKLNKLDPETTTFTYPDSFVSFSKKLKPYYGELFMLHQLEEVITTYGFPEDDLSPNYDKYWEKTSIEYIEFQIWDNKTVDPYIKKYNKKL